MPTKKPPKPSAATALKASASRETVRPPRRAAGGEHHARERAAIPASWSAAGDSPPATPTIRGSAAAPLAEIGEITLIVPIARAR